MAWQLHIPDFLLWQKVLTLINVVIFVDGGLASLLGVTSFFFQALKFLRTYEVKPYVIFIKAPTLEKLKESRMPARARATEADSIRPFTVSCNPLLPSCGWDTIRYRGRNSSVGRVPN